MNYRLSWHLRRHADERHTLAELAAAIDASPERVAADLDELSRNGFRFSGHPMLGLEVVAAPQAIDRDEIAAARPGRRIGRTVHVYDSTRSTNDVAARLAATGPGSDGVVVTAEEQTAGRGRQGAAWFGSRGDSLLVSIVHWAAPHAETAAEITPAMAVAGAEALAEVAGVATGIKWPNDIEIGRRKVAGILVERPDGNHVGAKEVADEETKVAFVVGIGVNVNQAEDGLPEVLADRATSLRIAAGHVVDRPLLLDRLLDKLEGCLDALEADGLEGLLGRYVARSDMVGRHVVVREAGSTFSGTVASISPHYALIVHLEEGGYRSFKASKVRLL